ncbi:MAG: DNA-protecting protein DprA [Ignavibacteriales bacterium]|nr:DNA-protecting protein DprA [Ignavibacteriales bacterium]
MYNVRDLLRLSSVPQLGPLKIRALLSFFRDPEEVFRTSPRMLAKIPGISKRNASAIAHHKNGEAFADDQLKRVSRLGARIISLWEDEYPELLRKIYDPPPLLFVLGEFSPSDRHSIAIVGTRLATHYGQKVTETFAGELVQLGITVVSGLARGIDTYAHQAALRAQGRTIAVVGSGLDIPYPPENRSLSFTIARQGAVVSEFPMGTKPDAPNFPRRNRIISGLSLGTLVVESAEDGGAMITASSALDQNREVFAVPGSIFEKKSIGPHTLVREGRATLVQSVDDLLAELKYPLRSLLPSRAEPVPPRDLSLFEQTVFDRLSLIPVHIDTLCDQTEMAVSDVLVTLLTLEFKGLVKQLPGKLFVKV